MYGNGSGSGGLQYKVSSSGVSTIGSIDTIVTIREATSDTVNGNPRTGQFTRPRGIGVYFYEYCGRVIQ